MDDAFATRADVWKALIAREPALLRFIPKPTPDERPLPEPARRDLRRHPRVLDLAVRAALANDGTRVEPWLGRFISGRDGTIGEACAYGLLVERGMAFRAPCDVPAASLYRRDVQEPVELDGVFEGAPLFFDIKLFGRQRIVLDRLARAVNEELASQGLVAEINGALDLEPFPKDFARIVQNIVAAARPGAAFRSSKPRLRVRFASRQKARVTEQWIHPFRFASENASGVLRHAEQIPRSERYVIIMVYTSPFGAVDSRAESQNMERALSRRVFVDLVRHRTPITGLAPRADVHAKIAEVASSLGGLLFIDNSEPGDLTLRAYLNPNAKESNRVTRDHFAAISGFQTQVFDAPIEDFEYDNY